jgi:hypothetical protein
VAYVIAQVFIELAKAPFGEVFVCDSRMHGKLGINEATLLADKVRERLV